MKGKAAEGVIVSMMASNGVAKPSSYPPYRLRFKNEKPTTTVTYWR